MILLGLESVTSVVGYLIWFKHTQKLKKSQPFASSQMKGQIPKTEDYNGAKDPNCHEAGPHLSAMILLQNLVNDVADLENRFLWFLKGVLWDLMIFQEITASIEL